MVLKQKYTSAELLSMEAWRGLLSMLVVMAHLMQIFWCPLYGNKNYLYIFVGTVANISVVCFFVLSGVLISYSGINLTSNNVFDWRKYLINRFSRIYPAFIFVLVLCLVMVLIFPLFNGNTYLITHLDTDKYMARKEFYTPLQDFALSLCMVKSKLLVVNGPLWSLILEWWLYISGMFIIFIVVSHSKKVYVNIIFFVLALLPLVYNFSYYNIASLYYAAIWFLGLAYTFYLRNSYKLLNLLLCAAAVSVLAMVFKFGFYSLNIQASRPLYFGVFQFFIAVVFLKLMFKINLPSVFNKIGGFSYTLYILHFPVALFIFSLTRNFVGADPVLIYIEMILVFALVFGLSYFISLFTEKKSLFRNYLYALNDKSLKKSRLTT